MYSRCHVQTRLILIQFFFFLSLISLGHSLISLYILWRYSSFSIPCPKSPFVFNRKNQRHTDNVRLSKWGQNFHYYFFLLTHKNTLISQKRVQKHWKYIFLLYVTRSTLHIHSWQCTTHASLTVVKLPPGDGTARWSLNIHSLLTLENTSCDVITGLINDFGHNS